MGNGQWAMGNGQWAMGNGQWAIGKLTTIQESFSQRLPCYSGMQKKFYRICFWNKERFLIAHPGVIIL